MYNGIKLFLKAVFIPLIEMRSYLKYSLLILVGAVPAVFSTRVFPEPVTSCEDYSLPDPYKVDRSAPKIIPGMELVWNDEFDVDGKPDPANWGFEYGFVRNRELQWYQPQNAYCLSGELIIEGRKEKIDNPNYNPQNGDWRAKREFAGYSSSSITTRGLQEWNSFGYYEIRAKIDTSCGAWPAIWMLGKNAAWPHCGEIDIMEFYRIENRPSILANAAWGSDRKYKASWDTEIYPLADFLNLDPDWTNKYHTWSMKWNETAIRLYVDGSMLNEILLSETLNPGGGNPFTGSNSYYLILNLALGSNGGDPSETEFPVKYRVDYVRVYKVKN